jgi:hypothetical protein
MEVVRVHTKVSACHLSEVAYNRRSGGVVNELEGYSLSSFFSVGSIASAHRR